MMARNNSGPLAPKLNVDNFCAALGQKDKMIAILEKEVQGLRRIRQNYDSFKDHKNELHEKCESLAKQIAISRTSQETRVDNSHKFMAQLKMIVTNLQNELQNKNFYLKDLKCNSESLVKSNEFKQNEISHYSQITEQIKNGLQLSKHESERLVNQIWQISQQIQKMKAHQKETEQARQKLKGQILNTQTFIRQLQYQQTKGTDSLSMLQDQNNSIDEIIEDLKKVYEMTKVKIKEMKEQKEQITMRIKTKELEKGRIQTQYNEKLKLFKSEREKEKNLKEMLEAKKNQILRSNTLSKDIQLQVSQTMKTNLEIQNINEQLQSDLMTCRKHLQNVFKNNETIKQQLHTFQKTNLNMIKKLRKPMDEGWSELNTKKDAKDWKNFDHAETADGFMDSTS